MTLLLPSQATHVQHVKRGSIYEIVRSAYLPGKVYKEGDMVPIKDRRLIYAEFQHSGARLTTLSWLVVYRCLADAKYWCREVNEFNDGRFVVLTEIPKPKS